MLSLARGLGTVGVTIGLVLGGLMGIVPAGLFVVAARAHRRGSRAVPTALTVVGGVSLLGITEAYISFLLALRDGQYRQAVEYLDQALAASSSEHS
jgi:hypothetical protein